MADPVPSEQQPDNRRIGAAAVLVMVIAIAMLIAYLTRGEQRPDEEDTGETKVTPYPGGVTRYVSNPTEWDAAVAAAQPGDVIRITADIHTNIAYRGNNDGGAGQGDDGTPSAPIVITADPGVWIDAGNMYNNMGALDVLYVDNVHVVDVSVRNSQFGIRCYQCRGADGAPVRIADNTITQIGHSGLKVAGHWGTFSPSSYILVEGNEVTHTGQTVSQYGEGIYIGYGATEWVDVTSHVVVRGNEVAYTGSEGIDIKPGTADVVVEDNLIHDIAPINGGAISAHYVNVTPNPNPNQLDQVVIRGNRIWNQNLAGVPGANDWAIWVGHGGVEVRDNLIWGLRNTGSARAVRIRAQQPFGPHPIVIADNVFWTATGWLAEGTPSGASNVVASGNRGPVAGSNELVVDASAFPGPVPALGVGSTADAGAGPGSGFGWSSGPPTTTVIDDQVPLTTVFSSGAPEPPATPEATDPPIPIEPLELPPTFGDPVEELTVPTTRPVAPTTAAVPTTSAVPTTTAVPTTAAVAADEEAPAGTDGVTAGQTGASGGATSAAPAPSTTTGPPDTVGAGGVPVTGSGATASTGSTPATPGPTVSGGDDRGDDVALPGTRPGDPGNPSGPGSTLPLALALGGVVLISVLLVARTLRPARP